MLNGFVLLQGERNGRKELCVREVLLLFCCLVQGESGGDEFAFLQYVEFVAPLEELNEPFKCVCLQWTSSGSEEKKRRCRKGGKIGSWWRQISGLK